MVCELTRGVLEVIVRRRGVPVDAVHLDEAPVVAARVLVVPDALLQDVVVPVTEAVLAAEDELNGWVQQLDGLGPLVRLLRVVLLGELLHLPRAPALVAQSPVFDLSRCEWAARQ